MAVSPRLMWSLADIARLFFLTNFVFNAKKYLDLGLSWLSLALLGDRDNQLYNPMEHSQEQLFVLATQANKLELGPIFNNYFFDPKTMIQAQVPTVQQIFDTNPNFKSKYFFLICLKIGMPWEWKKMSSRSRSFIRFANFLLEKGFTEEFWAPLGFIKKPYIKKATLV